MTGFPTYLLKLNLMIILAWLLYRLVFRGLTFFRWNRFYLLGSVVLSFILPVISLPRGSRLTFTADLNAINWDQLELFVPNVVGMAQDTGDLSVVNPALYLYLAGIVCMVLLVFLRFRSLRLHMLGAEKVHEGKFPLFVQDADRGSFTFFRRIYLDRHAWDEQLEPVYRHEKVHASQLHSIDMFFMLFIGALLWFNPFVYLLLRSVRENHEFLADAPARSAGGLSLADYLVCLRDETLRRHSPAAVSHFKSSTIKTRIIMLTNKSSHKYKKGLYFLMIPLFSLLFLAFQSPVEAPIVNPVKMLQQGGELVPSIFPLPETFKKNISQRYGEKRIHPISQKEFFHRAVDIPAPQGTKVFATAGARVLEEGYKEGWGNYVILSHGSSFASRYTHLKEIRVKKDQLVEQGQVIATVGSTGRSTAPHLHYEVWKDGEHVNPADYY